MQVAMPPGQSEVELLDKELHATKGHALEGNGILFSIVITAA